MKFDQEVAYFEADEALGQQERLALNFPDDQVSVEIARLACALKRRRIALERQMHEGRPDYHFYGIISAIDADLYQHRPDLYLK